MNFGEKVKMIRAEQKLTQEQLAEKLNISRQAVSNWENNRNLPDIEMLITMANVFHLSLDNLILGEDHMNNMTKKLICDGSENRRARMNVASICVGGMLLLIGAALLLLKAVSVEYIDAAGVLHENFFLIPLAFLFFFGGVIAFLVTGIRNIVFACKSKHNKYGYLSVFCICGGIILILLSGFFALWSANSGEGQILIAGCVMAVFGLALIISGCFIYFRGKRKTQKKEAM